MTTPPKLRSFSKAREQVLREARELVRSCLERFGQIATPEQVEYAAKKITEAVMTPMHWPEDAE